MDRSGAHGPGDGSQPPGKPAGNGGPTLPALIRHTRRPGDRVVRTHRSRVFHLRRILGIPGLFSVGYGDVGSSIFYALGIVAVAAMGATPVALGIAGLLFVFTALTYAEGTSMFPEAGGYATFARHGFNDMAAFGAGWALMFGYVITISISLFTAPHYLGYFWPALKDPKVASVTAMGIVLFLMAINVVGVRESSRLNITLIVIVLLAQFLLVVTGLALFFDRHVVWERIVSHWPTTGNLVFGVALATVAYTGIEAASQLAGEAKEPQKRVPRALVLLIFTVLLVFAGVSLTAFSVMSPVDLAGNWSENAVAGIANGVYTGIDPQAWAASHTSDPTSAAVLAFFANAFRSIFPPLVAIMGATILVVAGNAGLLGISRITFSLADHQSLPPLFGRVHRTFKTPYVAIVIFGLITVLILAQGLFLPNIFTILGGLYAFGSMLSFALAHASILALRVKQPDRSRPFRLKPAVTVRGRKIPITAVLGLFSTLGVWVVVIVMQPYSRWFGLLWMGIGMGLYVLYRRSKGLSLTKPGHPPSQVVSPPGDHPATPAAHAEHP